VFKLTAAPALSSGDYQRPDLSVQLLPNLARLSLAPLHGELEPVQNYLEKLTIKLPGPTAATLSPCLVLPLGQGQWLLQGELPDLAPLKEKVATTDQSDAWCGFTLKGIKVPAMLERLVMNPPSTYAEGCAVRTQIEHLGCWVVGLGSCEWQILGPRSSADSLFHALKQTAQAVDALTDN